MTSLGQELKKQRESRNISLDEMASSTKIVGRYLEALEQDRFDVMPGGFFIKGIVRTYAKYVGLDEAEVLARYREAGVLEEAAKSRAAEPGPPAAQSRPARVRKSAPLIWVVLAAVVLLVVVAVTLGLRARRPRPAQPSDKPAAASVEPMSQAAPPREEPKSEPAPSTSQLQAKQEIPQAPAAQEPAKQEWKGLTLDMTFLEETWIQVYADGDLKVSGLFPAGGKARTVAEKEILIGVLGNAGGLTYELNGNPGKALGRTGEVKNNIRITLDNLKDYLREPTAPSN